MDTEEINDLTEQIIGCAITVSRKLGPGFLERVYEMRWPLNCSEMVCLSSNKNG